MSDAGEALIDNQTRITERIEERTQQGKRAASSRPSAAELERRRRIGSLKLARIELERQQAATRHEGRLRQIAQALEELDRQIAEAIAASSESALAPGEKPHA